MALNISAVVVTYRRKELLKDTLSALLRQSVPISHTIVVDNCSKDGTVEMVKDKFPGIRVIELEENLGGAGGFHIGIGESWLLGSDWTWVMDDDVVPSENALQELLNAGSVVGEVGFLCSRVTDEHGNAMNVPEIDLKVGSTGYLDWTNYLGSSIVPVKSSTFVSVLINRMALEKVGLPFLEMFIWGDDTEFTTRISKQIPSYAVGKSNVVHKRQNGKSLDLCREMNPERIGNYFYLYRNLSLNKRRHEGVIQYGRFIAHGLKVALRCVGKKYMRKRLLAVILGLFYGIFFSPKVKKCEEYRTMIIER